MKYVNSTLNKDENVLGQAVISKWSMTAGYALAVLTVPTIVMPIAIVGIMHLIRKTTEMAVTNRRVIRKHGLISRKTAELRLAKVETVSVAQGIIGRIFNYGNVVITGSGTTGIVMKNVKDPLAFRASIEEACGL